MSSSTATLPKPPQAFQALIQSNSRNTAAIANKNTISIKKAPSTSTEAKPQSLKTIGTDTYNPAALAADPVAEKIALEQEFTREGLKHNLEETDEERSWLNNFLSAFRISPAKERNNVIALNTRQQPLQPQPSKSFLAVA